MVAEVATGQSLSELYQQRIFDPLGMVDTSYQMGSPEPGTIVNGYYTVGDERNEVTSWNASQGGAAGAIVSTAADMVRFAKGLFTGGLFKQEGTLDEMLDFRELSAAEGKGLFASYGLGVIDFVTKGFQAIGHGGQTPGFQSVWFYAPESETVLVFLSNSGTCGALAMPIYLPAEILDAFAVHTSP